MLNKKLIWLWLVNGILLFFILTFASQAWGDLADCIDATCRISTADGGRGTGCVFEISQGTVYVLTAAHVVPTQIVQCEFWQHGHQSGKLPGIVINRRAEYDVAIVALKASVFGGRLPKAIPIAPTSKTLQRGEPVTSVGCAKGAWSTGWKGHVLGYEGHNVLFVPVPAGGRSGSAIFDAKAEMIVGVLHSRDINDTYGRATSTAAIRAGFQSTPSKKGWVSAQCGPDGCEVPGRRPILPYNGKLIPWKKQQPQQQPSNPWPTLPTPAPAVPQEVTVEVDLTPISNQLTEITDLLLEMRETHHPSELIPEPLPYVEPPPLPTEDFEARQMAEVNHGMILTLREESTNGLAALGGRLKENESNLGTAVNQIKDLALKHGSLKDQFQARVAKVKEELGEEASKREIRIAYVKDLIAEKLGGGGATGLLKMLGMPTAIIIGAWLIRKDFKDKRETGDPLMITKLWEGMGEMKGRFRERFDRGDPPPQPSVTPLSPAPPAPDASPQAAA